MGRTGKIIVGLTIVVFTLMAALIILSVVILNGYIPSYSGEEKVEGISNETDIYRDSSAVIYIDAESESDAYFALGFAHAQERMFQMDLARRAGEGRLAEVLGNAASPFDKMFRTIGLYRHVKSTIGLLNPKSKSILESYTAGVNEYIRLADGNYSFEFDVLGYQPYEWKIEHSLVIAKLMAWELNISWWTDITFSRLVQKFGEERAAELLPQYDENAPTIIPKGTASFGELPIGLVETDKSFRKFFGIEGTHIGSNNWVVNSKKSASGKPIIANDPHLAFSIPGKWVVAVISSNDLNVSGFTLPGVPGVVIGKNKNISWVLTNVMADDADFYVEELDSSGTHYFVDNQWKELKIIKDTINVKDSANIAFQIKQTHRGPIISDIHPYHILFKDSTRNLAQLSMRWTALDFSDEAFAIYSVNTAENWDDFTNALRYFTVPGQNFVYADKDDNIGYVCAAKLPMRKNNSPTLVYDGTTTQNDWLGYVPYSEMPRLFNPSENFIASANNKTVKTFPYQISNIWEPPSRITRITELLTGKEKQSVEDFQKYQMDFKSNYAKEIVPYILRAFQNTNITDANLKLAINLLRQWDFEMNVNSQVPTIYLVFLQKLLKNIFRDEMNEAMFKEYLFIANIPYKIIPQLLRNEGSRWFDNVETDQVERRDDILRKSLVDALSELEEKLGENIAYWQWSELHTITFNHPFSGISDLVDGVVDVGPFQIGGDGTTIFNTEYSFTKPYKVKLGPSMRFIYDFSKPDEFYFVLPTGQSGHVMSDHYSDMTDKWLDGKLIKINTNSDVFTRSNHEQLKLLPR